MKMNQITTFFTKRAKFLLLVIIGIGLLSCSIPLDYRTESTINEDFGYYTINPENILDKINQGETNVFTRVNARPTQNSHPFSEGNEWGQADYFRIAQALFRQIWQEPYEEQNISYMDFSMDCSDIEKGLFFSDAILMSYKLKQSGKEESRVEYQLDISPSRSYLFISKGEYVPNINKKKPINLNRHKIPVEEALQIAEKNGGVAIRSNYRNECIINATMRWWDDKGWDVYYRVMKDDFWQEVYEIRIDPETGIFKIISVES